MAKAPEPALDYVPIPKQRYTSREFAQLEWERMWTKVWLLAGRASDARDPGDYFTFEIGPESVLIVRQRDGSLAARYNVCMHRGNRLREPGRGHASELRCLFHGWQYDLDGAAAALDPSFPQGCADRQPRCAGPGRVVFLNLDRADRCASTSA
jgi:phenylpropionate dioxygenase-like ring-hydroxylating dioxygenase large terminal subunit